MQRDRSDETARYAVYDGRGGLSYRVYGRIMPSGELIHITDTCESVKCKIRRLGFNRLSAYKIRSDYETVRMNLAAASGRAVVQFSGISFSVRGDVLGGSYDIVDADSTVVCTVCKDYAKSCVRLSVNMEERELFCIAAAVCIDGLTVERAPALQTT